MYIPDPVKLYVLTQIAFPKLLVYSKLNPLRGEEEEGKKDENVKNAESWTLAQSLSFFWLKLRVLPLAVQRILTKHQYSNSIGLVSFKYIQKSLCVK